MTQAPGTTAPGPAGPRPDKGPRLPLAVALDPDPHSLAALVTDLNGALAGRARIRGVRAGREAEDLLDEARLQGSDVALLVVADAVDEGRGATVLRRLGQIYPAARRLLLTPPGAAALAAVADGAAHDVVGRPWAPAETALEPAVRDLFDEWSAGAPATEAAITVVGDGGPASHRLRNIFTRNPVPHRYLPADSDPGRELLTQHGPAGPLPLVLVDGEPLWAPQEVTLWEQLGETTTPARDAYDVVIAGAGPAGLAAAVNAASEGLTTLLVEREAPGGQAGSSSRIENYVGFPTGVSGREIARRAYLQALRLGAESIGPRQVEAVTRRPDGRLQVTITGCPPVTARSLVAATGADWTRLRAPGVEQYTSAGVFYGAALAEAAAMHGAWAVVVGGANSAGQAAVFLSDIATTVTLVVRGDSLQDRMSQYLIDQLAERGNVQVVLHAQITGVRGGETVQQVELTDRSGQATILPADAVFVFIGARPASDWLAGVVARDDRGFLLTGQDAATAPSGQPQWTQLRPPLPHETTMHGVFAVGDVRAGAIKRVASAVGEGSTVVPDLHTHLAEPVRTRTPPAELPAP